MNINPNFQMLKLPVTVNQKRENSSRAIMANNNGDTFVHSAPSFKGAEQDLLKKHPELATIIGAAVGVAVAKIVEMLGLNEPAKDNKEYVYTSTVTDQCEDTYSYYANNTSVNTDKKNSEKTESQQKTEETKTDNRQQDGMVQFVFPKKGCRLKTNETKLRALTENMSMPADYAERLQNVCKKLFGKENYTVEDKVLSATEITTLLYDELVDKKDDLDSIKSVIDKYNSYLEAPAKEAKAEAENVNFTETATNNASKTISTDNNKIEYMNSDKRDFITKDNDGNIININRILKTTEKESQKEFVDNVYKCFVSTIFRDYKDKEKNNITAEKPMWLSGGSLSERVLSSDIKKEIENQKGAHRYKNIVGVDYDELADVINGDSRFKQLFTIHSALRLIDRFVCFDDDSDVPSIEAQCKNILDNLFKLIKPHEVEVNGEYLVPISIDVYKIDDKNSTDNEKYGYKIQNKRNKDIGKYGCKFTLRNAIINDYDKINGPRDIIICLREKQDGDFYNPVDNTLKQAIISTIFPDDKDYKY